MPSLRSVRLSPLLGLVLTGIGTAAILTVLTNGAEGGGLALTLQDIPPGELEQAGIVLTEPVLSEHMVSSDDARQTALAVRPDSSETKELTLAHLVDSHAVPPLERDVWALTFDVAGLPWTGGPAPVEDPSTMAKVEMVTKWSVMFIDASTGEPLFSLALGGPP